MDPHATIWKATMADERLNEEDEIESILQYAENDQEVLNLSDSLGSLLNDEEEDQQEDENQDQVDQDQDDDEFYPMYSGEEDDPDIEEDDLLGVKSPTPSPEDKGDLCIPDDPPLSNTNTNNNQIEKMIVQSPTVTPVTTSTNKSSRKSLNSTRDFDFPPSSKIIKLTDTGRYNHVKPLRVGAKWQKRDEDIRTGPCISPWRKTPDVYCSSSVADSSSPPVSEKIPLLPKPAAKSVKSRLQLSNTIADLKFKPRTEFRSDTADPVSSTPPTPVNATPTSSTSVSSPVFSKRAFNFSARSSFGVAMSQLKSNRNLSVSDNGFHLTHLQSAKPAHVAANTSSVSTVTDTGKFTLTHLK